jgi:hypothetical protein
MSAPESEEIKLIPSNLQLFLVCVCFLALLGLCFAVGYNVGKRNPRSKATAEEVMPARPRPVGGSLRAHTNYARKSRIDQA